MYPSEPDLEIVVAPARRLDRPCEVVLQPDEARRFPARHPEGLYRALPGVQVRWPLGLGGAPTLGLRGFDAGTGRDVAVTVDGVPINEPLQPVGHGYVDLGFLPMLLVDGVDACPGATDPAAGPFATAGSVAFRTGMPREGWRVRLGGGTDGSGKATVGWRPKGWDRGTFAVGEIEGAEGVGNDRSWRQLRVAGGLEGNLGPVSAGATLFLHDGRFDIPTPVRQVDLDADRVRFYAGYRAFDGRGATRRLLLSGRLRRPWWWGGVNASVWFGGRELRARQNPTGFLDDAVEGDGVQTRQGALDLGGRASVRRRWRFLEDEAQLEAGASMRVLVARQRLEALDADGEVRDTTVDRNAGQTILGGFAHGRLGLFGHGHLAAGVRVVRHDLLSRSRLDPEAESRRGGAWALLPHVSAEARPADGVVLHAAYARGHRPPPLEAVVDGEDVVATLIDGGDGAADVRLHRAFALRVGAWGHVSPADDRVDPVSGERLALGPTRRMGGDARATLFPEAPVRTAVEVGFADARSREDGALLPHAPRWLGALRVEARDLVLGPVVLDAGLRGYWVGRTALPDGFTARATGAVDVHATLRWRRWTFDLRVDQAAFWRLRDAERVYASRWDPRLPRDPLPERHVVGGNPFSARLGVGAWF